MRRRKPVRDEVAHIYLVPLAIIGTAFLLGGLLGCAAALHLNSGGSEALSQYIRGYLETVQSGLAPAPDVITVAWKASRFLLLAVLLGFTALGVAGMPLLFLVRGFLLSFSVTCFVSMFGGRGGLLAFLLLGVSGVATIPPLFLLGVQGMSASRRLLRRCLGGQRDGPIYSKRYFFRWGGCAAAVVMCVLFDLFAVPGLLRLMDGML